MNDLIPYGANKRDIEKLGSEVAEELGYTAGADLRDVVRSIGGQVIVSKSFTTGDNGALASHGDGTFTIHLSPFTNELRDRFTIAHELGHLFLHAEGGRKQLRVGRAGSGRPEWEANWFAAGFLMPEVEFRQLVHRLSIGALAAHFKVSTQAIAIRTQELGIRNTA